MLNSPFFLKGNLRVPFKCFNIRMHAHTNTHTHDDIFSQYLHDALLLNDYTFQCCNISRLLTWKLFYKNIFTWNIFWERDMLKEAGKGSEIKTCFVFWWIRKIRHRFVWQKEHKQRFKTPFCMLNLDSFVTSDFAVNLNIFHNNCKNL